METKTITVDQIADMIKLDFLYELGKQVINEIDVELLPDTPANEQFNMHLTRFAACTTLDQLGIPSNAFDHIFKKKAIETLENMMLSDLRDLNKEAAKEAMLEGDINGMMARLMNVRSLSEVLEN